MTTSIEPLIGIEQVALHFGVTTYTVRNWLRAGCPHYRVRATLRFRLSEVEAWAKVSDEGAAAAETVENAAAPAAQEVAP